VISTATATTQAGIIAQRREDFPVKSTIFRLFKAQWQADNKPRQVIPRRVVMKNWPFAGRKIGRRNQRGEKITRQFFHDTTVEFVLKSSIEEAWHDNKQFINFDNEDDDDNDDNSLTSFDDDDLLLALGDSSTYYIIIMIIPASLRAMALCLIMWRLVGTSVAMFSWYYTKLLPFYPLPGHLNTYIKCFVTCHSPLICPLGPESGCCWYRRWVSLSSYD
jgi:hypothetical protein